MSLTEIKNMPYHERLRWMEELWASLCNEQEPSIPSWHRNVVEKRLEAIKRGRAKSYTLDEIRRMK